LAPDRTVFAGRLLRTVLLAGNDRRVGSKYRNPFARSHRAGHGADRRGHRRRVRNRHHRWNRPSCIADDHCEGSRRHGLGWRHPATGSGADVSRNDGDLACQPRPAMPGNELGVSQSGRGGRGYRRAGIAAEPFPPAPGVWAGRDQRPTTSHSARFATKPQVSASAEPLHVRGLPPVVEVESQEVHEPFAVRAEREPRIPATATRLPGPYRLRSCRTHSSQRQSGATRNARAGSC
jgi:hypothetical protein